MLRGVVQSTALGCSSSNVTLAASRRDHQKIRTIPAGGPNVDQPWGSAAARTLATQAKVVGIGNWRRNSLLGEFPSHHLPPGKHLGTDRQGSRSWQPASMGKPRQRWGCQRFAAGGVHAQHTPLLYLGGWSLQRNIRLCWRMSVVLAGAPEGWLWGHWCVVGLRVWKQPWHGFARLGLSLCRIRKQKLKEVE